jgi:hypothetical protein
LFQKLSAWRGRNGKAVVSVDMSGPDHELLERLVTSLLHKNVRLGWIGHTGADVESHVGRLVVA